MGDASFVKHVYGKTATPLSSLDSFDPRPPQYRNNASSLLPELLDDSGIVSHYFLILLL